MSPVADARQRRLRCERKNGRRESSRRPLVYHAADPTLPPATRQKATIPLPDQALGAGGIFGASGTLSP